MSARAGWRLCLAAAGGGGGREDFSSWGKSPSTMRTRGLAGEERTRLDVRGQLLQMVVRDFAGLASETDYQSSLGESMQTSHCISVTMMLFSFVKRFSGPMRLDFV